MTSMWKAAAAFILAIGAGGFVAGSVLGSPDAPEVGDPVVVGDDSNPPSPSDLPTRNRSADDRQPDRSDDDRRKGDDDRRKGDDDRNDTRSGKDRDDRDDDPDTVYHQPDDVDDDGGGEDRDDDGGGDDDNGDD